MSDRTRQKNKRGYIEKWDQTDSHKIPDRGGDIRIAGLPSVCWHRNRFDSSFNSPKDQFYTNNTNSTNLFNIDSKTNSDINQSGKKKKHTKEIQLHEHKQTKNGAFSFLTLRPMLNAWTISHRQGMFIALTGEQQSVTRLTGSPPHQAGFLRSSHDKQNFLLMFKSNMSLSTMPWLSGYKPCGENMNTLQWYL